MALLQHRIRHLRLPEPGIGPAPCFGQLVARVAILLLLLVTSALAAPPGLYRCPQSGGGSSFQDRPCAGGAGSRLDAAGLENQLALRRWLRAQQSAARVSTPASRARALPSGALQPALMAACSTRFYDCAHGDGLRMQRCLVQVPLCSSSRTTRCCPAAALERFRDARASGATPAQATRHALLGE